MTLWDYIMLFYFVIASILAALWLFKTDKKKVDVPCKCIHPIKCDTFDRCMKNEH
jgi:hypothetical protein